MYVLQASQLLYRYFWLYRGLAWPNNSKPTKQKQHLLQGAAL
jgi:hypothetical protein